ncbi:hypothetical protein C9374_010205 [Naegleria lovaniensis]|uniref:Complex 1 LYR protein domain-containing protein n=1 Tax=Naegleria lovaniensis TaxID=51637 RepID=A0AA88KGU6_NAELO|nr:uncharacterized protein C9374_011569 [Naegleria lovaniensis]XP_044544375.1 uncharacterized protein C9374_010205 [Naegleria lovaniensis]KAG2373904.1 hypothetical protein C9374_011569 [Naegleria lovaniensis]KAG2375201.1 hypothetical protein C9374_010205 [Naegleria lovaniensis]
MHQRLTKGDVLSLYRRMLKQSLLIPTAQKRENLIQEIRSNFRKYKPVTNDEMIEELWKKALDKYGYICMITPKRVHTESQHISAKTQFVKVDGEWKDVNQLASDDIQKQDKAAHSNWGRGNLDPDQVKRHEYLVRRQNFMEGPLKGYRPVYERNWLGDD